MAVSIEGKTISQLIRVDEITGHEILPMSVWSDERSAYVTRGITVDDFFKIIYNKFQETDNKISYLDDNLVETASALEQADAYNYSYTSSIAEELKKTNAYVSYNAEGIIQLGVDMSRIYSYSYEGIGRTSYSTAYNYQLIQEIGEGTSGEIDNLKNRTAYLEVKSAYLEGQTAYNRSVNDEQNIRLRNIEEDTAYLHTQTEHNAYVNDVQNVRLNNIEEDTEVLHGETAYNAYINVQQTREINTLYKMNDRDAFDDFGDPDDDIVHPDLMSSWRPGD